MKESDEDILLSDVEKGVITNWYELEMKFTLFGLDVKKSVIEKMLGKYMTAKTYALIYNTMMKESVMDEYFSEYGIISKFLELNQKDIYEESMSLTFKSTKFKGLEMLKSLDVRNPKYLLKYFLYDTTQPSSKNRDAYFILFMDIIERTKIRATKMDVFKEYLKRLEESYREKRTFEMMCA